MNDYSLSIRRGQAWKIITLIFKKVGLVENYGTHTLRKTWGYHARMNGVGMELIMHKLNHESIAYTKRYLGITDDELEAVANRLNLKLQTVGQLSNSGFHTCVYSTNNRN
jgi:site-specific recombinase XerD